MNEHLRALQLENDRSTQEILHCKYSFFSLKLNYRI